MARPRLHLGRHLLPGIVAIGIFILIAVTTFNIEFTDSVGTFEPNIIEEIGLSLVNAASEADGYLVPLILIALLLDAALDGAVYLARRDGGEQE